MGTRQSWQLLLEKGADVNAQGGYYGNALQAASWWGHEAIVAAAAREGGRRQLVGRHLSHRAGGGFGSWGQQGGRGATARERGRRRYGPGQRPEGFPHSTWDSLSIADKITVCNHLRQITTSLRQVEQDPNDSFIGML